MKVSLFILFTIWTISSFGQISDIKEEAKKNKSTKKSSNKSTESNEDSDYSESDYYHDMFLGEVFSYVIQAIGHVVVNAQTSALASNKDYSQRISLELPVGYGQDIQKSTANYSGMLKLNWGVFGTVVCYSQLAEISDRLSVLDWLVNVKIPIQNFTINYGIGASYLYDIDISYFANSIGFSWRAFPNTFISSDFLWTQKKPYANRFKQSFTCRVDQLLLNAKSFHLGPFAEYNYQNYFGKINYSVFNLGLVMKLY